MKFASVKMVLFIIAAILVTSCGGRSGGGATLSNGYESIEAKTLTLWFYYEGKERFALIKRMTDDFSLAHPGIVVNPVFIPFNDFNKRLSIGLANGDTPDLVMIDSPNHTAYAAMGLFADITPLLEGWKGKEQYYPASWQSASYQGRQYGVPLGINSLALFYNKKLFDQAGIAPPSTWDELKEAATKLTNGGVTGLGISSPGNEEATFQFLPWLYASGADYRTIGSPEGIHSLAFLAELVRDGYMSNEIINWTQADLTQQFAMGKVAMMVNGSWQIPELAIHAPDLSYGIVPIPKEKERATVIGGENIGVVSGPNVAEAVKFVKYVASPEVSKTLNRDLGYFPARRDVANDPYWSEDPRLQVFLHSLEYARSRGPHPRWPEISSAISVALDEALSLHSTPDAAAGAAQSQIDKLMKMSNSE